MTEVRGGGIRFTAISFKVRFEREVGKLSPQLKERLAGKLRQLKEDPLPHGLRFEKLKGYNDPDLYSFHVDGNYKVSLETVSTGKGMTAVLRRVGTHNEIDRSP